MVINPIVGVYIPIIGIPYSRLDDHPQYSDFWPWHICVFQCNSKDIWRHGMTVGNVNLLWHYDVQDFTVVHRIWNSIHGWCFVDSLLPILVKFATDIESAWWNLRVGLIIVGIIYYLGGGFKYCLFSPLFGEDSHFDSYFSDGLKPPTR